MKTRSLKFALLLLLMTWMMSIRCVDSIELNIDSDVISNLVVNGKLVMGNPSVVTVTAGRVVDYDPTPTEPLDLKSVELFNGDGENIALEAGGIGRYELKIPANHPFFHVEAGKGYGIRLTRNNGDVYESEMDTIETPPVQSEISISLETRELFFKDGSKAYQDYILFDTHTPTTDPKTRRPVRLRWDVIHTSSFSDDNGSVCYLETFINDNRVRILDGTAIKTLESDYRIYEPAVSNQFAEGAYITSIQEVLSPAAYDYWANLSTVNNRTGNMFEQPVGKLRSNIHRVDDPQEDVFGFFYATKQDTLRRYVDPDEVGNPQTRCPFIPAGPTQDPCPQACCDCTRDPKSLDNKPRYWRK